MMGYDFTIKDWYKIKHKQKAYPWPCESDPKRIIALFDDDVLTKTENGKYMKHTGLCCFDIPIPDDDVIVQDEPADLRLI